MTLTSVLCGEMDDVVTVSDCKPVTIKRCTASYCRWTGKLWMS